MNISISINHKYTKYAYVMLTSLFMNHKSTAQKLTVYILQSDLTKEDRECLEQLAEKYGQMVVFMRVDVDKYLEMLPTTEAWSKEMYYRLLLGELLPREVKRILYLDVDIIVNQSLDDLYDMDLQGMDLAAVDDPMIQNNFSEQQQKIFADFSKPVRYFNSGVVLFDLERIREKYTFAAYCNMAEKFLYQLTNPDQDLLNYAHAGSVYYIDDSRFNLFSQLAEMEMGYKQVKEQGVIIHFAGRKPWTYSGTHYEVEKLWWDYAKMTPFYYELMESVFLPGLNDTSYQSIMALLKENKELKKSLTEVTQLCHKLYDMINGKSAE